MNKRPRLGAHVSAAGGLTKVIPNAQAIEAECFQIHASSPRQWVVRQPEPEAVDQFLAAADSSGITAYYIHAPYLINLASPDQTIHERSLKNLAENLQIGETIKAKGVILHLGSAKGEDRETAFIRQVDAFREVLGMMPGKCKLVLENSAGGGSKFGATLEDIGRIVKALDSERIGVCFDTCHAFAGGVIEKYSEEGVKRLWDNFEKEIGMDKLVALHINDSKSEYQSNHDIHENLGEGYIGLEAFKYLAAEPRLAQTDWILEVPGAGLGPRIEDVRNLKKLFE